MGDYWRTSGRSRLQARAKNRSSSMNGLAARAEGRAVIVNAHRLAVVDAPRPATQKNHPKRPRKTSERKSIVVLCAKTRER